MQKELKYFIYARKSTDREDKQIASIEDQIFEVQKIAKDKGLNIIDIISESKSAKEPGRIHFNEMLKRIHKGEAQGILCWKLNRLARNPVDGGQISWMLQQGILSHIQTYGREYRPSDNVIMMQVEFGMANQYVKDLSVDTKRGMRRKAERGWYPVPVLPIGYIHNKTKPIKIGIDDEIHIDEERYPLVKKLWKILLTKRFTLPEIHKKAELIGLRNRKGKPYTINTIRNLFKNPFYAGDFYWYDDQDERVKYAGKHKAMISINEYLRVQDFLSGNERPTRRKSINHKYKGIIKCGNCNSNVCADHKHQIICTGCKHKFSIKNASCCPKCFLNITKMKKPTVLNYTYYRCTRRRMNCMEKAVKEKLLESQIQMIFERVILEDEYYKYLIQLLQKENKKKTSETAIEKKLKVRIKKLKSNLDKYLEMRVDGELNAEEYLKNKTKTQEELDLLEIEYENNQYNSNHWIDTLISTSELMIKAKKIFKSNDDKRKNDILSNFCSNLKLKEKNLYFIRPKAIQVLDEGFKVYSAYFATLEPKKSVGKYSIYACYEDLNAKLLPLVCDART